MQNILLAQLSEKKVLNHAKELLAKIKASEQYHKTTTTKIHAYYF